MSMISKVDRQRILTRSLTIRIGNLDIGNLLKYVFNPENGFIGATGIQVAGSMRCMGAFMQFTVGNTNWPLADQN